MDKRPHSVKMNVCELCENKFLSRRIICMIDLEKDLGTVIFPAPESHLGVNI